MEADELLQGFVFALFTLCGASSLMYCIRLKLKQTNSQMKQSDSMEDLTSISTEDPQS